MRKAVGEVCLYNRVISFTADLANSDEVVVGSEKQLVRLAGP